MAKLLIILLVAIVLEAIGVVFLSRGLKEIGELDRISVAAIAKLVGRGITNANILRGVFFEALFFFGLLTLMSKAEVSFVWPLTALGFVATTIAAKIFLHEQVSRTRWAGVLLITVGAAIVSWSEKTKEPPVSRPAEVNSNLPRRADP